MTKIEMLDGDRNLRHHGYALRLLRRGDKIALGQQPENLVALGAAYSASLAQILDEFARRRGYEPLGDTLALMVATMGQGQAWYARIAH